jgi:molybdenum cofactor sulfurtransferase
VVPIGAGRGPLEDGTVNFLNMPAVEIGLRYLERIGIETIHAHVETLTERPLATLAHSNGAPVATIYGPRDLDRRGATIAVNFLHPDGRIVDERYVDRLARAQMISVRTGCFCNPGAGEVAFTISRETLVGDRPPLGRRRPRLARAPPAPRP